VRVTGQVGTRWQVTDATGFTNANQPAAAGKGQVKGTGAFNWVGALVVWRVFTAVLVGVSVKGMAQFCVKVIGQTTVYALGGEKV
jgi:hypothetical protein